MASTWRDTFIGYFLRTAIYLFNLVYSVLRYFGIEIIPLTFEKVIEPLTPEQRKEASRSDFSVPLEYFLEGFNRDPQTSGFLRFVTLQKAREIVIQREAVKSEIQKNPDILQTPVDNPLVIIGLARTGTTMLQRMLKNDPQFMSTMLWEMMAAPVPPGRPEKYRDTDRYKVAEQYFKFRDWLGLTEMDKKHKMGPELDEECMVILYNYSLDLPDNLSVEGLDERRHFMYNLPDDFVDEAYKFYKHYLQCMFYNNLEGGKRLLLKAPIHTLFLDTYRKVLPDAKFIFTYRNFNEITASLCSLMYELGKENGYSGDRKKHGKRILEFYKHVSDRVGPSLKKMPKDSFIILSYDELMSDTLGAVEKIYSHFGLTLTEEAENAMKAHIKENPKDKFGKHEYNLEEWGITEEDVKDAFKGLQEYLDGLASS